VDIEFDGDGGLTSAAEPTRRMSLPAVMLFSLGTLPTSAIGLAVVIYLSPYFASYLGVPLLVVGAAFGIVRAVDFLVDPALGMIMDKTRTRIGRYRVWQLIGIPVTMIACYRLFLAPRGVGEAYLVVWLFVLYLGSSALDLSRSAWAATLSSDYDERSRIFGVLSAVGVLGNVAILVIPIVAPHPSGGNGSAVPLMGWFVVAMTPVVIGASTFFTGERIHPEVHAGGPPWRDYLGLLRKPGLMRLFLGQVAVNLGPNTMSAMYLFFFKVSRGFTEAQASILLLVYLVAGVAGAPMTASLARRIGKHRALMVTTTLYSLGLCTVMLFPRANVLADAPMMFFCGFMNAGFAMMISAMAADFGDEIRLDQGKEQLSLIYAMLSLGSKVALAASVFLTYGALAAVGFNASEGAVNMPSAIHGLEAIFLIGPIFFVMVGGACFLGWKLDAQRHGEIRAALKARDAELEASRRDHPIAVEAIAELIEHPGRAGLAAAQRTGSNTAA
jgi:Na+/melibiose symporter-like transporter